MKYVCYSDENLKKLECFFRFILKNGQNVTKIDYKSCKALPPHCALHAIWVLHKACYCSFGLLEWYSLKRENEGKEFYSQMSEKNC